MAMPWHPMWPTDPPYGNPGNPMGAPTQPSQSSGGAYLPYGNPTNPMGAPSAPHQGTGGAAGSNNPTGAPSAPGAQQSTTSAPWHPLNAVDQSYQGGYGGYQGYGGYGGYQGYQGYQAPTPYNPSYQGGQSSAPPSYLASSLNQTFGAQAPSPSPTPPPGFGGIYNSGSNGNPGPRPTASAAPPATSGGNGFWSDGKWIPQAGPIPSMWNANGQLNNASYGGYTGGAYATGQDAVNADARINAQMQPQITANSAQNIFSQSNARAGSPVSGGGWFGRWHPGQGAIV